MRCARGGGDATRSEKGTERRGDRWRFRHRRARTPSGSHPAGTPVANPQSDRRARHLLSPAREGTVKEQKYQTKPNGAPATRSSSQGDEQLKMKSRNAGALGCPLSSEAREGGRRDLRSSSPRKACRTGESRARCARGGGDAPTLRKGTERTGDRWRFRHRRVRTPSGSHPSGTLVAKIRATSAPATLSDSLRLRLRSASAAPRSRQAREGHARRMSPLSPGERGWPA